MYEKNGERRVLVSYLTLRRILGILGVSLPILVAFGCVLLGSCTGILDSISAYYGTVMRDVFVGVLFAMAWFLFAYRGYEPKDDVAGDIACVAALGVALFPITSMTAWVRGVHSLSAASFFLVLSYFSVFLFTKSDEEGALNKRKQARNRIYVACGVVMVGSVLLALVYGLFLTGSALSRFKPVFVLETVALWAFGVSWFIKGETLLKDE